MSRTTTRVSRPGFTVDPKSVDLTSGRQIDWANVADSFKNANGDKVLPAGTVVGELLGAGKVSPRVATTNPAVGLLATEAVENSKTAALSGYGLMVGGVFYENLLPDATGTPKVLLGAVKTELSASGSGYAFEQYGDSRAG